MPQKLNKAGKMQDYIPKGNGDASGEYGTSNGTNKNFTTSEKKESKANVITENKSVVVGKKEKGYSEVEKADWGIKENEKQIATLEKSGKYPNMLKRLKEQNEILKKQKQEVLDGKREKIDLADDGIERKEGTLPFGEDNKANVIDNDLSGKETPKGKSATRKDKYGNPLVSDEAFKVGYEAGKKYLDEMTKYYDKDKLLMSNVFLGYLNGEINKGIEEAGLDENYDMTYQDANEIIGSLLNVNVDMEEYERGFTPSKVYKGGKYTGYKPKDLK